MPLRGVDVGASDPTGGQQPLGLAHVYIDLDTTTQVKKEKERPTKDGRNIPPPPDREETRPLSALEAVAQNRRMVLTGDPGGGKSTFANHLAHCLAAHLARPGEQWLDHLPKWPPAEANTVPILVILRDFAQSLPETLPKQADPTHLWTFIEKRLAAQKLDFVARPLLQALEDGRALLLLDGLDEVTTAGQRAFVRDAVLAFLQRYHERNRAVVTCRILSYQPPAANQPDLRLPSAAFPVFELASFNADKIDRFIAAWYGELVRLGQVRQPDAAGLTRQLRQAVRRPDLWRLAANPLLLTVMALVHTHQGRLPDARALLYEDTVDVLLWRWEQVKAGGQADAPHLRQLLLAAGVSDLELKKTLWQVAFEAHGNQEGDKETGRQGDSERGTQETELAGISELALTKALAGLVGDDWNWARQVIEVMKTRAGLLLERSPGVFTFPHRTFQEYLAGAHLSVQRDFATRATELAGQGANWREVILLAVGRLVYQAGDTADRPLNLVNRLCPSRPPADDTAWRNTWLAGDALLEMGLHWAKDDEWGQELLERVRGRLVELVTTGRLSARERAQAGLTLSRLGDPRPGVCTLEPELIEIPAGTFLMGDEKHPINLDAFAIARYPVTNAQFRAFIEDGGYTEKWQGCWTEEGWQLRTNQEWTEPRLWDDEAYNQANQPVVGVSWYEAVAYSRWLSAKTGRTYRLPSEAEWERAARHTDGRQYPWGDEWQVEAANSGETRLNRPTAVGLFPAGAAVCGAMDMAGNVWEWCSTRWWNERREEYPLPYRPDDGRENLSGSSSVVRVNKGGAYYNKTSSLRCAYRSWSDPYDRDDYIGCRLIASPSAPLSSVRSDTLSL